MPFQLHEFLANGCSKTREFLNNLPIEVVSWVAEIWHKGHYRVKETTSRALGLFESPRKSMIAKVLNIVLVSLQVYNCFSISLDDNGKTLLKRTAPLIAVL